MIDEGSVEITAMLLENGANPDAVDNNGLTPAQLAMSAGNNKVSFSRKYGNDFH